MKVILSIKPKFVEEIFSKKKRFEYRTVIFTKPDIKTVIISASSPVSKVVGEFKIGKKISDTPKIVWEKTKKFSTSSLKGLEEYAGERGIIHAIEITALKKYPKPLFLQKVYKKIKRAPQNFQYVP